ncbi:hypothetical protein BIW11_03410 [Tropilaelaps mercedesae]|uniref:Uncharacterized protein n=1 Tax=Tropilaelaps mercedesae TaxID=418985 RepID=A0A1V9XM38_9ACAR|nr:hypothetical protein BIW11_03410 [Tropilaelaps mercedesae]
MSSPSPYPAIALLSRTSGFSEQSVSIGFQYRGHRYFSPDWYRFVLNSLRKDPMRQLIMNNSELSLQVLTRIVCKFVLRLEDSKQGEAVREL